MLGVRGERRLTGGGRSTARRQKGRLRLGVGGGRALCGGEGVNGRDSCCCAPFWGPGGGLGVVWPGAGGALAPGRWRAGRWRPDAGAGLVEAWWGRAEGPGGGREGCREGRRASDLGLRSRRHPQARARAGSGAARASWPGARWLGAGARRGLMSAGTAPADALRYDPVRRRWRARSLWRRGPGRLMRHPGQRRRSSAGPAWSGRRSLFDRPRRLRHPAAAGAQGQARLVAGPRIRRAVRGRDLPRRRTWEPASQHTPLQPTPPRLPDVDRRTTPSLLGPRPDSLPGPSRTRLAGAPAAPPRAPARLGRPRPPSSAPPAAVPPRRRNAGVTLV